MNIALTACKCADFNKAFNLTIVVKEVMRLVLFQKIRMYFSSLWLLFVFLFIRDIDFNYLQLGNINFSQFLQYNFWGDNLILYVWLSLALLSIFNICLLRREWSGSLEMQMQISDVSSKNSDYVAFVSTCILPLLALDSSELNHLLLMVAIVIALGVVFIKNDMYYANPTLAIFGYRLYEATLTFEDDEYTGNSYDTDADDEQMQSSSGSNKSTKLVYKRVTFITHDLLRNGDYVEKLSLNKERTVFFAKRVG